jgi:hypothetical protein
MSCIKCNTSKCTCETTLCINPLIYMMENVFSLIGTTYQNILPLKILEDIKNVKATTAAESNIKLLGSIYDLPTALISVLTSGISVSNNKNLCCPDCKSGLYTIGNLESMTALINTDAPELCCVEHMSSLQTWSTFSSTWNSKYKGDPKCCNTEFSDVIELWINASSSSNSNFYLDDVINTGIFETSSFNGLSGLGVLFNYLQLSYPTLTADDYLNILGIISSLGVVVSCDKCAMTISDIPTYIDYINPPLQV